MMIARLREFSASDRYKEKWMSIVGARWTLYRFLANRCSKEFLALYLEQAPNILERASKPGLGLSVVPEVGLAIRLHEFALLPEENRRQFIETVSSYAIDGEDVYALNDTRIRSVFNDSEFDELVETVRTDLLPKLADVRRNVQINHDSSVPPDEHMQNILESFSTLKKRFREDEDAVKIIERETDLANEWIAETGPLEPKVNPRILGAVEPSEKKHGSRSIFDDIDDGDA